MSRWPDFQDRTEKQCTGCGRVLELDGFYQKRSSDPSYKSDYGRALQPCKDCRIARNAELKDTPKRKREIRSQNLSKNYGITLEQYEEMLTFQGGVCAICGDPPSGTNSRTDNLHVDHCHQTGRVRGLLCHMCNRGLGSMRDNPRLLRKGAEYLEG